MQKQCSEESCKYLTNHLRSNRLLLRQAILRCRVLCRQAGCNRFCSPSRNILTSRQRSARASDRSRRVLAGVVLFRVRPVAQHGASQGSLALRRSWVGVVSLECISVPGLIERVVASMHHRKKDCRSMKVYVLTAPMLLIALSVTALAGPVSTNPADYAIVGESGVSLNSYSTVFGPDIILRRQSRSSVRLWNSAAQPECRKHVSTGTRINVGLLSDVTGNIYANSGVSVNGDDTITGKSSMERLTVLHSRATRLRARSLKGE